MEQHRHDQGYFSMYLYRQGFWLDLPPTSCLSAFGPAVRGVIFYCSVYHHSEIEPIAHQISVENVMLYQPSPQNYRARFVCEDRLVVHATDVFDNVQLQLVGFEGVKIKHIANGAVGDGRAVHADTVLGTSVVDGLLVVYFLPHKLYHFRRRPPVLLCLLFLQHLSEQRFDPVLEQHVVAVGNHHVANAVDSLLPQLPIVGPETVQVGVG